MTTATIHSGKTQQRVTEVKEYRGDRVLIVCWPDVTPRWVSRAKVRVTP